MRIGRVAADAGVNVDTVRYYERQGLIDDPRRVASGYRDYGPEAPRVIRFVKRAQGLGFTLTEIKELLRLRRTRAADRTRVLAVAQAKIETIRAKLRALRSMHDALEALARSCACGDGAPSCPILEALESDDGAGIAPREEGRRHA